MRPTTTARRWITTAGVAALALVGACQAPVATTQRTAASSGAPAPDPSASTSSVASTTSRPVDPPPPASANPSTAGTHPAELPRGGKVLFPHYRLVGYAGAPGSAALGRLGVGDLEDRIRELESRAESFGEGGRVPQPVLELLATVVQGAPGRDGKWRSRLSDAVIREHLNAARRHRAILLLGIQPGRASFLEEVRAYEQWLRQPDVGLALDPEWAMAPGQVPMRVFGHTTGSEINEVTRWVARIVKRHRLPQKAVIVHELAPDVIRQESAIVPRAGVALVKSVDGIGSRTMKVSTWRKLTARLPKGMHVGFKLFFEEDRAFGPLMTPRQVLALEPTVDYVLYE